MPSPRRRLSPAAHRMPPCAPPARATTRSRPLPLLARSKCPERLKRYDIFKHLFVKFPTTGVLRRAAAASVAKQALAIRTDRPPAHLNLSGLGKQMPELRLPSRTGKHNTVSGAAKRATAAQLLQQRLRKKWRRSSDSDRSSHTEGSKSLSTVKSPSLVSMQSSSPGEVPVGSAGETSPGSAAAPRKARSPDRAAEKARSPGNDAKR